MLELESVDQNLQAISQIESSWSLPALDNAIKLDLATFAGPTAAIGKLLAGLEEDLYNTQQRVPYQGRSKLLVPDRDFSTEDFASTVAGFAGVDAPEVPHNDAVRLWKQAAVDRGFLELSPEEVNDPRWYPEFNYVAREMAFEDTSRRFQGDKPGSFSIDQVGQILEDWLSPRGLVRAATELDLWWDPENIEAETAEWGEKWQAFAKEWWNPLKLIDAVTGPIDDVLFPVVNWMLMLSGIGNTVVGARAAMAAGKGLKNLDRISDFAGLYKGTAGMRWAAEKFPNASKLLLTTDPAADIARLSQPSLTSSLLAGKAPAASAQMQRWRNMRSTVIGKKAMQQTMRVGFASNLQSVIDERPGESVASLTTVDEIIEAPLSNPLVDWGVDLFFSPTHVFEPGTFIKPARALGRTLNFTRVAENQKMVSAWHDPVKDFLQRTRPDMIDEFDRLAKDDVKKALAYALTDGDEEKLGAAMSFVTIMGGLDGFARQMSSPQVAHLAGQMSSSELRNFHQARNQAAVMLTYFDEDDVDTALRVIGTYGDQIGSDVTEGLRRGSIRGYSRPKDTGTAQVSGYEKAKASYLEPEDVFRARAGAVPEGHVRLYGHVDEEGILSWGDELAEGADPYILDLTPEEAARVLDPDDALGDAITWRYTKRSESGSVRRYRLSEAAEMRVYDQEKLTGLREIIGRHNKLREAHLKTLLEQMNPRALSVYVNETLDSFGRWDDFIDATDSLHSALARGDLQNVTFKSAEGALGGTLSQFPKGIDGTGWSDRMFNMLLGTDVDPKVRLKLMNSMFAPLARDVDPTRMRVTVEKLDTPTKQEALSFAARVKTELDDLATIERLERAGIFDGLIEAWNNTPIQQGLGLGGAQKVPTKLVEQIAGELAATPGMQTRAKRLIRRALRDGVDVTDLKAHIYRNLDEFDVSTIWSHRYQMQTRAQGATNVVESLSQKVKDLQARANFMAAEIEGLPGDLAEELASKGYRAVYGVNFTSPQDVLDIMPEFGDVTRRTVQRAKMGQFFQRQDHDWIRRLKHRQARMTVQETLLNAQSSGKAVNLNIGDLPGSTSGDLQTVMDDLFTVMYEIQEDARHGLDRAYGMLGKFGARMTASRVPLSVERIASELPFPEFVRRMKAANLKNVYTDDEIRAIHKGLQRAQSLGWEHLGLYQIEAKLRSQNQIVEGLKLLAGTKAETAGMKLAGGAANVVGAVGGYKLAAGQFEADNPDRQFVEAQGGVDWQKHLAGVGGALLGRMAASAVLRGQTGFLQQETGALGLAKLARAAEESDFVRRWGYMADGLANIRDRTRFALSPIFDMSRYSEALILNQVALPEGLAGKISLNSSPKGFRRALRKELVAGGASPDDATRRVQGMWDEVRDEFARAARGDFDYETIDGVSRRFSSVGILGFSPSDWMASTYGQLRRLDVEADEAYELVRHIYTYGMTGRSAGEMSMNFVFFPFSFMKKTLGHMTHFFQQDLGRLFLIQDALKTYEVLNENYDLTEVWRERLPIINRMHRLNLLAYGIGPGRFGGVNAPYIEALRGTPLVGSVAGALTPDVDSITSLFLPQQVELNTEQQGDQIWELVQDLTPVWNDAHYLLEDAKRQARVAFSSSHMTAAAEASAGWEEWNEYREDMERQLAAAGITWRSALQNGVLGPMIQQKKVEIQGRYPAWEQQIGDSVANNVAVELELNRRLQNPKSLGDQALGRFNREYELWQAYLRRNGSSLENPETVPASVYGRLRRSAVNLVAENDEFLRLYNRFYRRILGDITTEV